MPSSHDAPPGTLGILPQVLPVIASQLLYFFESNTRQQVSFLILMILAAVAALDWMSQRLRGAIIGRRA
jgi:phosphonate transport system permease protein